VGTHKQLDRSVEDMRLRDAHGEYSFRIANPGFGIAASFVPEGGTEAIPYPKARRDYDAVEIGLRKRMSKGWAGRFSYLWSRLEGNESGLAQTDFFSLGPNYPRETFPGQAIDISEADFFAGFDTQELLEEQEIVREPRFLQDFRFQPPRAIRFGARFSF
jgi:hypothetical protein